MRRSPRTRLLAASVVAMATIGVAACGGDDDDTSSTDGADVTLSTSVDETTAVTATDDTVTLDTSTDGTTSSTGGGEVGSQDEYVQAAQDEVASEFDDGDISDCIGESLVNDDVYAAIEDAGMTVEQFSQDGPLGLAVDQDVADQVASDFAACGDLLPQLVAGDTELECAEENLTNDQIAEFLSYSLLGQTPTDETDAAYTAMQTCIEEASTSTT